MPLVSLAQELEEAQGDLASVEYRLSQAITKIPKAEEAIEAAISNLADAIEKLDQHHPAMTHLLKASQALCNL